MSDRLSYFFNSTIVAKYGCPVSPTQLGLCIDDFEEMVVKIVKEEVVIGNVNIMLLLQAGDVVLLQIH